MDGAGMTYQHKTDLARKHLADADWRREAALERRKWWALEAGNSRTRNRGHLYFFPENRDAA